MGPGVTMTAPSTALRLQVEAALAVVPEVAAGDWSIANTALDAVQPPVFILEWGPDPWRQIKTMCVDDLQMEVIAVSARLNPEGNMPLLEAMVDGAIAALYAARLRPYQTLGPGPLEVGNIQYLAARVQLRRPVEIGAANAGD